MELEQLKTTLLNLDTVTSEVLKKVTFDKHGNVKTGRKVFDLYYTLYGDIEIMLGRYPDFDYSDPKHGFNNTQLNLLSHIANYDNTVNKLMEKRETKYYY